MRSNCLGYSEGRTLCQNLPNYPMSDSEPCFHLNLSNLLLWHPKYCQDAGMISIQAP